MISLVLMTAKKRGPFTRLFRTYGVAAFVTAVIWIAVGTLLGRDALLTVVILTVLEVTFSFDNAVINAKILVTMSHFWRMLFLTVGIFIAVFVVRFLLPLFIVGLSANLDLTSVAKLAFEQPAAYARALEHAAPIIEAFGGTFLLLVGASYFIDDEKRTHWLGPIERSLSRAGQVQYLSFLVMLALTGIIYLTVAGEHEAILVAGIAALAVHTIMAMIEGFFEKRHPSKIRGRAKTGIAALSTFIYLEMLDASFSLDSVIGAFAITTGVVLIVAGLGAGAIWVRSMTVHLVETKALNKFRYLEHGAHWAIAVLGIIMLLKLYGLHPADWFVGTIGLVFVGLSVLSSKLRRNA